MIQPGIPFTDSNVVVKYFQSFQMPMTGKQKNKSSQNGYCDITKQHTCLSLYQKLHILDTH